MRRNAVCEICHKKVKSFICSDCVAKDVNKINQALAKGFEIIFCDNEEAVKSHIKFCEGKHIQQIVYSSYHDVLTQICFNCKKIRTSLKEELLQNLKEKLE